LSDAITETEPNVSTDDSFLTIALCLDMRCTPSASTTDNTAGNPSGTAATARDTPSSNTGTTSAALRISDINKMDATTTSAMTTIAMPSIRPMRPTSFSRGVGSSAVASSMAAIEPISVDIPHAVTTARPVPCAIAVPLKTMLSRSPSGAAFGSVAASLSTASLSPVSAASCTRSDVACTRRASAATASPSANTSTSPSTSAALGTRSTRPSRSTDEVAAVMRLSAATASCALDCCTKPRIPLSKTIAAMTIASTGQPARPSTHQATSAITIAASKR
jgi:lysozyme